MTHAENTDGDWDIMTELTADFRELHPNSPLIEIVGSLSVAPTTSEAQGALQAADKVLSVEGSE